MSGLKLSILDRIIGLDPETNRSKTVSVHYRITLPDIEEALHRDLTFLLNTRRAEEVIPTEFSEAARSIVTFGLPDFTGCSALDRTEQERIRKEIENAIRTFEPRLSNVTVSMDRPGKTGGAPKPSEPMLRYHVRALLNIEPEPEPVLFDAVLEPDSGRVAVERTSQKRDTKNAG